jgi:hypothetical protein
MGKLSALPNWNSGMLEYWNNNFLLVFIPNIPPFHCFRIPDHGTENCHRKIYDFNEL